MCLQCENWAQIVGGCSVCTSARVARYVGYCQLDDLGRVRHICKGEQLPLQHFVYYVSRHVVWRLTLSGMVILMHDGNPWNFRRVARCVD